jgi:hypothetical protein
MSFSGSIGNFWLLEIIANMRRSFMYNDGLDLTVWQEGWSVTSWIVSRQSKTKSFGGWRINLRLMDRPKPRMNDGRSGLSSLPVAFEVFGSARD